MADDDFRDFAGTADYDSLGFDFSPGLRMKCVICDQVVTSEEICEHVCSHLCYDRKKPNDYIEKLLLITLQDQWVHNRIPPDCQENVVHDRWCYYGVCCRSGPKIHPIFNDFYTSKHMLGLQQAHQFQNDNVSLSPCDITGQSSAGTPISGSSNLQLLSPNSLTREVQNLFEEATEFQSNANFDKDQQCLDIRGSLSDHASHFEIKKELLLVDYQPMDTNERINDDLHQSVSDCVESGENNISAEDTINEGNKREELANHEQRNEADIEEEGDGNNINEEDEAPDAHAERKESARQRLSTAFHQKQEIRELEGLEPVKLIMTVGRDQCRDPYNECGGKLVAANQQSRLFHVNSDHLKLVRHICRLCGREFTCFNTRGIILHLKGIHKILDRNERERQIDYSPSVASNQQIRQMARDVFFPGLSLRSDDE